MTPLWIGITISVSGTLFAATLAATLASWQSTKKKMIEFELELTKLRMRMDSQEQAIVQQVQWQSGLDQKMFTLVENTAKMSGILETMRNQINQS